MNYIVLDLEFNQYYNFSKLNEKDDDIIKNKKKQCPFEIIQIGAIKLNSNFEVIDKFNKLIKPSIYKRLHPIVEKLTNFQNNIFEDQENFIDIYYEFLNFLNNNKKENILCTWGNYDIKILYRNANFYNLNTSQMPKKFIDVQIMASNYLKYIKGSSISLKKAIEMIGINSILPFHDALNDAMYTSQIFITLKNEPLTIKNLN